MDQEGLMTIARVRDRAVHCRALSLKARSSDLASELEKLARDYDRDAIRLEGLEPDSLRVFYR